MANTHHPDDVKRAVVKLINEGKYPLNQTYDDAGLDIDGYVEFFFDMLKTLGWETE